MTAAGQMDEARTELGKAIELWKNADSNLDELRQAKQHLAALGVAQTLVPVGKGEFR
jgi:hypothetical protein